MSTILYQRIQLMPYLEGRCRVEKGPQLLTIHKTNMTLNRSEGFGRWTSQMSTHLIGNETLIGRRCIEETSKAINIENKGGERFETYLINIARVMPSFPQYT